MEVLKTIAKIKKVAISPNSMPCDLKINDRTMYLRKNKTTNKIKLQTLRKYCSKVSMMTSQLTLTFFGRLRINFDMDLHSKSRD